MKHAPLVAGATLGAAAALAARAGRSPRGHPLLDYVARPDGAYRWRRAGDLALPLGVSVTRVSLVSQEWQGLPWKHALVLLRPPRVDNPTTLLLLVSGDDGNFETIRLMAQAARALSLPTGVLFNIPNQPLLGGKAEDALIAHTLVRCLETGDCTWPLLFPMVKSVVRAMDAAAELSANEWPAPVERFVITGASKRGWTTWLTGAVDPRVAGIAPLVYDNLNLPAQMAGQLAAYGAYSEEVHDYTAVGLPQRLATPAGRWLATLIDPYALRDRLHLPKLLVHATNDRYWTLESVGHYFEGLPGDKHLLYIPNAGHALPQRSRVLRAVGAFARARADGRTLPGLAWEHAEQREALVLCLRPEAEPVCLAVWTAAAPTRDFRDARWQRHALRASGDEALYALPRPAAGFTAVIGEVTYRASGEEFSLSTTPRVVGPRRVSQ